MTSKTTKNILLAVPLIAGVAVLVYYFTKKPNKSSVAAGGDNILDTANTSHDSFPLKKGSTGSKVGELQQLLNSVGQSLTVDNQFGSKTEAALKSVTGKTSISSQEEMDAINSKWKNAQRITSWGGSTGSTASLMNFDAGFLSAWAGALASNLSTFTYNLKSYNTKGGTSVQAGGTTLGTLFNIK